MKKKLAILLAIIIGIPTFAIAAPNLGSIATAKDTSTSAGKTITANISYASGRRVYVWSVFGRSDKSTSAISIQRGNATGSTTNYTTVTRLSCGAAQVSYIGSPVPIFVGDVSYGYRFLLDSTTANALIVNYSYE